MSLSQIAWLLGYEGIDLFQSCIQAMDGPLAVRSPKREAPSPAGIRLIDPHHMMRKATRLARKDRSLARANRPPVAFCFI